MVSGDGKNYGMKRNLNKSHAVFSILFTKTYNEWILCCDCSYTFNGKFLDGMQVLQVGKHIKQSCTQTQGER